MAVVTRFLQLALIDVIFGLALATLAYLYSGTIHSAGLVAIAAVLAVFAISAGYALLQARRGQPADLELAVNVSPMIAMLGTVAGFLIAFSGGTGDVQERVLGASTALASTFVGIACAVVLMVQARMLKGESRGCCK